MKYSKSKISDEIALSYTRGLDGQLVAFELNGTFDVVTFSNATPISAQPGIYIITNPAGKNYVGHGGVLRQRIAQHSFGVMQPLRIVAIVGQAKPLDREEAAALERIVAQSLWPSGDLPDRNQHYPNGSRVDDDQYAALQAGWASLCAAFRNTLPALARPWVGPEYAQIPVPGEGDLLIGGRRTAQRRGLKASIVTINGGYVIEKGSVVRAEPHDEKRRLFWATRSEGRYAGILVPDDAGLKLTRGVYFKTIAACSRFVFDTTETAIWQSPDDFGDFPTQKGA